MTQPHELVAAEVRAEVARQRATQAQLAILLDTTQATVSRRMSGEQPFTLNELFALAEFLDVPVTRFFAVRAAA